MQRTLAQMQGMGERNAATTNFQYNGKKGVGVFGQPTTVELPLATGGYQRRVQLDLTVTREQLFQFESKTKLIRLASVDFPETTYVIDFTGRHDPYIWTLTLVKTGGSL
jgi:hypothetical protein